MLPAVLPLISYDAHLFGEFTTFSLSLYSAGPETEQITVFFSSVFCFEVLFQRTHFSVEDPLLMNQRKWSKTTNMLSTHTRLCHTHKGMFNIVFSHYCGRLTHETWLKTVNQIGVCNQIEIVFPCQKGLKLQINL